MTRGNLYCILDDMIMSSQQFNGDMYPSGHGETVIEAFEKITDLLEFVEFVAKFNSENHNYKDCELTYPEKREQYFIGKHIVMTDDNYFHNFGADWTFWKNLSSKKVTIKTIENKNITIEPNGQVAINYGHFEGHIKSFAECQEYIKKEEEEYKKEQEKRERTIDKKDLYFRNGASDKEYHVQVVGTDAEGYNVLFQYGRRGNKLREDKKTDLPVTKERALYLMRTIVNEKLMKGYKASTY